MSHKYEPDAFGVERCVKCWAISREKCADNQPYVYWIKTGESSFRIEPNDSSIDCEQLMMAKALELTMPHEYKNNVCIKCRLIRESDWTIPSLPFPRFIYFTQNGCWRCEPNCEQLIMEQALK